MAEPDHLTRECGLTAAALPTSANEDSGSKRALLCRLKILVTARVTRIFSCHHKAFATCTDAN
ncbi:hypothetical protein GCM10010304_01550 [Streptomyces roseoviolaceus]